MLNSKHLNSCYLLNFSFYKDTSLDKLISIKFLMCSTEIALMFYL